MSAALGTATAQAAADQKTIRLHTVVFLAVHPDDLVRDRMAGRPVTMGCHVCGRPAEWFARGVSGCAHRCGARSLAERVAAEAAVDQYRADLPKISKVREEYRRKHRGIGVLPPRLHPAPAVRSCA